MTEDHKIWMEQCQATEKIQAEYGTQRALDYLVGEKFPDFLEAAEDNADFRAEIPAFVAEIRRLFEAGELKQYLESATKTVPWNPTIFKDDGNTDPEEIGDLQKDYIRQRTREHQLMDRAREWLLGDAAE